MRRFLAMTMIVAVAAVALPGGAGAAPRATGETLTAKASLVLSKGTNFIHVEVTGRTSGGAPSTGQLNVVTYGYSFIPDPITIDQELNTVVGHVTLVNGKGHTDIPITAALIAKARPPAFLHSLCCSITVHRPSGATSPSVGIAGGPGDSYYGPVVESSTTLYLEVMSRLAIGHSLDTSGLLSWGAVLASGAPRGTAARSLVESSSYRRYRATLLYQRWLGRRPTSSEQAYWADRLTRDTTSGIDLAMAAKPAARDAGGTTNAARGAHLAAALHLPASYGTNYTSKLNAGTPWTTVVRDAYWSSAAVTQRINDLGPRTGLTPSLATLGAKLKATGDEREVEISVLATLPNQHYPAYG